MSDAAHESNGSVHQLPDRPNLRHLKDQAKVLVKAGEAASLSEAHFTIARKYGFQNWPKLKAHVEAQHQSEETRDLKQAIDENDLESVTRLMTRNPALHRAPIGYNKNGPLTWVAECRVPWEPPSATRLALAQWMIDNGSDVHQGGDGPLMRAALVDCRIPMMELLLRNGADVNAEWSGYFPIILAPCETVQPGALKWLLEHGANPNCGRVDRKYPDSALDYLIGTYSRSPQLGECIDVLVESGCVTRRNVPSVLAILSGRLERLRELLDSDEALVSRRFAELDFGSTGYRRLLLRGSTLLHVAAEYGNVEAAELLIDRGADINATADAGEDSVGGQTPIFHASSQFHDYGLAMVEFLVGRGADLAIRTTLPGHYERHDEFVECTPLGYSLLFPGQETKTVALLRQMGAKE
jgi:Ankyrin repeats (many copies)